MSELQINVVVFVFFVLMIVAVFIGRFYLNHLENIFYNNLIPIAHKDIHRVSGGFEVLGKELKYLSIISQEQASCKLFATVLLRSKKGRYFLADYIGFLTESTVHINNVEFCTEDHIKELLADDVELYKQEFGIIELA